MCLRSLADYAARCAIVTQREPEAVAEARDSSSRTWRNPPFSSRRAAVNLNRFYFCKLFKKTTGMTLTGMCSCSGGEGQGVACGPFLRITDVVYAAGFGSIPRFNSVFKRYAGMAPSQYRETLRTQSSFSPTHPA
jgi:methylphosphotriester-DNA--protein-cysteine methyltransferase